MTEIDTAARFLLVTGEKRCGKTTLIRRVVDGVGAKRFAGFYAAEQRGPVERSGFEIVTFDGQRGVLASVESRSDLRVGRLNEAGIPRYGVELEFLETVAAPGLLAAAESGKVVVLDEIGPMQLYSEVFRDTVLELSRMKCLVFGSIVSRPHEWADDFKTRSNVETFIVNPQNRATLAEMFTLYFQPSRGRPVIALAAASTA
jgi:nucleoside-triphosphatase